MTSAPSPSPSSRHNNVGPCSNYTFYDEDFRPMWNRGISRKIGESGFVQQTLPTLRLSWSPYKICLGLFIMGLFFIGVGIGIKTISDSIQEVIIPYTNCISIEKPGQECKNIISRNTAFLNSSDQSILHMDANDIENCKCHVEFELNEPLDKTVYIYYTLSDFYQNHLKYYMSRDENQLKGNLFDKDGKPKQPSSACDKFDKDDSERIVYPCGLMANSMFTDVINLIYHQPFEGDTIDGTRKRNMEQNEKLSNVSKANPSRAIDLKVVSLRKTGIAWDSDRMDKYNNPREFWNAKHPVWLNYTKPHAWKKTLWELDSNNFSNNGVENEDFIVWMRAAAFPWFRKLHRIVEPYSVDAKIKGLPRGNYTLEIDYNYDVSSFEGEKQIVFITTNIVAAKNIFLAIVYMGTGALCIFIAVVLIIAHTLFAPSLQSIEKSFKVD